ncbi:MAG: AAA family ATPase, partial [Clostridia bacterium]|nr:AAA family ATPase [Clostridia bacterium]
MKIEVIGYAGSGKSTLAKTLADIYNIPVLHLDNTKFFGDWQERTVEEQTKIVQDFLDANENWVIDGNFTKICPQRFEMTDMTIYLNFNRFKCFWSAYKRAKQ